MWDEIGRELTEAVEEFFISGQLLQQWNNTAITLVPKKPNADKITDFRLVSCCNMVYKVISKLLARRLELILTGFLPLNMRSSKVGYSLKMCY